jgi:pimeloyl-ACP methyl ester carboxylesterase
MNVEAWARGPRPPLLVVHDEGDPIVPRAEAERIRDAWSGAELLATTGLGHRGVRRDAAVIERAVAFLGA